MRFGPCAHDLCVYGWEADDQESSVMFIFSIERPMMKRLVLLALVASVLVAIPSGAASAGADKSDVCHLNDSGEWQVINVAGPAVDAHIAHGDSVPGDSVPGMPTYSFDEDCVPEAGELIFAVAYTDVDESDGDYNADVDVLISKLVDGNGDGVLNAGDLVITDRYPTDLLGTAFGNFGVTQATIIQVIGSSSTQCGVDAGDLVQYFWTDNSLNERYSEFDVFEASRFRDLVTDENPLFVTDRLGLNSLSPSQPASTSFLHRISQVDDTFLDIDLNCTS